MADRERIKTIRHRGRKTPRAYRVGDVHFGEYYHEFATNPVRSSSAHGAASPALDLAYADLVKAVTTFATEELSSVVGFHAGAEALRPRSFDLTDAMRVVHSWFPIRRRPGPFRLAP